jgi:hypothetical protein
MMDSSLAFSDLPIRLLFGVGMLALAVAFVYGTIVLIARLTGLIAEPGYAPTVLLISQASARSTRLGPVGRRRVRVARVREYERRGRWRSSAGGSSSAITTRHRRGRPAAGRATLQRTPPPAWEIHK